jgi:hypothetical protein
MLARSIQSSCLIIPQRERISLRSKNLHDDSDPENIWQGDCKTGIDEMEIRRKVQFRRRREAMLKSQMKSFFAALVLVLVLGAEGLSEGRPDAYSTDSDRIARAEQRVDQLRAKLFELETREMDLLARIDDLDYRLTPEAIQRALAFVGSPRPMDEFREALRIRLEAQRVRINRQLELVTANREQVMWAIREAEAELERIRQ